MLPEWTVAVLIASVIVAFFLAFGLGANDVANSFGTSVGSKVLTLRQACILATIFETLGASFLGQKVSDSLRLTLVNSTIVYDDSPIKIMFGGLSTLIAAACWMIIATLYGLPISGTHSIVGSMIGNAMVIAGTKGISWNKLILIVVSWGTSPLIAGVIAIFLYLIVHHFIKKSSDPLSRGLLALPIFFSLTTMIYLVSILLGGSTLLGLDKIPIWGVVLISMGVSLLVAAFIWYVIVPKLRSTVEKLISPLEAMYTSNNVIVVNISSYEKENNGSPNSPSIEAVNGITNEQKIPINGFNSESVSVSSPSSGSNESNSSEKESNSSEEESMDYISDLNFEYSYDYDQSVPSTSTQRDRKFLSVDDTDDKLETKSKDSIEVSHVFSKLMILTAVFGSFAHGANDVSNAIGPLITVWLIYFHNDIQGTTPIYLLFAGGIAISIGLWVLGKRVIYTVGEGLTTITPSSGFCIELGSALTVLLASHLSLPISTTHCKVGAIMFLGLIQSQKVDLKLFKNIALAWILTVPVTACFSAISMLIFINIYH